MSSHEDGNLKLDYVIFKVALDIKEVGCSIYNVYSHN